MQPYDLTQLSNSELRAEMQKYAYTQDINEALYLAALYREQVRRYHTGEWDEYGVAS